MKALPLFPGPLVAEVENTYPLDQNPNCRRCSLHQSASTVCMKPAGEPGGLLTVGLYPGAEEDRRGLPNQGPAGQTLHHAIQKHWQGPVCHHNALACFPGSQDVSPKHVAACRPYLAGYLREIRPTRVLALGALAPQALLGRTVPIDSVRKGFGWLANVGGEAPIPVLFLMHPAAGLRNRFRMRAFEEDLEWALTTPDSFFEQRYADLMAGEWYLIETVEDAERACAELRRFCAGPRARHRASFDLEWRGAPYNKDFRILSLAACVAGSNHAYVWDQAAFHDGRIEPFRRLVDDPEMTWVGQAARADELALHCYWGRPIAGDLRCTRLQHKLDQPDVKADLEVMSELVGTGGFKQEQEALLVRAIEDAANWGARDRKRAEAARRQQHLFGDPCQDPVAREAIYRLYHEVHPKNTQRARAAAYGYAYALIDPLVLNRYNARDTVTTGLLDEPISARIAARPNLQMVWDEITGPTSRSYSWMEAWGAHMDRQAIEQLIWHARQEQQALEPRLRQYCGPDLLLSSSEQVAGYIFGPPPKGLGLPFVKPTKGTAHLPRHLQRPSTDQEALEALKGKHPFVDLYLAYTEWDGYVEKGNEFRLSLRDDGRIHPSYLLDGARTGRPASEAPNMFNLRRADECNVCEGKEPAVSTCEVCGGIGIDLVSRRVRDCLVAPPGFTLLEVDRSQVEVRVMGNLTKDPVLIDAYARHLDVHQHVADEGSRITKTKIRRSPVKRFVFGVAYGLTAPSASRKFSIPLPEAKQVEKVVLSILGHTVTYREKSKAQARRDGWSPSWWKGKLARQRPLWNIASEDGALRSNAENGAFNNEVQASANDLTYWAHYHIVRWITAEGLQNDVQVVLSVYDSIMLYVRDELVPYVAWKVAQIMDDEEIQGAAIRYESDMKIGRRWGTLKKYKPPRSLAEVLERMAS